MEKCIKNLSKESNAYYQDNDYYEIFSQAEEATGKISTYLENESIGKVILDAGCGTGKYLPILEEKSEQYIGMDLSEKQLSKAKIKSKKINSSFLSGNLTCIPLPDSSIDLIVCSWVLGTILDISERDRCLLELKRVLKPTGKIILIENAEGGEFEEIRNRNLDYRTKEYNQWILKQGFHSTLLVESYFLFSDLSMAQKCFEVIYGTHVSNKIRSEKIDHNIIVFEYCHF